MPLETLASPSSWMLGGHNLSAGPAGGLDAASWGSSVDQQLTRAGRKKSDSGWCRRFAPQHLRERLQG